MTFNIICDHCHQPITVKEDDKVIDGQTIEDTKEIGHITHCCKRWKNGCVHKDEELSECCGAEIIGESFCKSCMEHCK